jgi:hypothetical protein
LVKMAGAVTIHEKSSTCIQIRRNPFRNRPIMKEINDMTRAQSVVSEPVTVDTDIRTHMLATYGALRRLIAVVTAMFLFTLSGYRQFGHDSTTRESISAYYYHKNDDFRMKDVFVGALTSVGLLLLAYQGYTNRENWALNIGGSSLLLVVMFPMDWDLANNCPGELTNRGRLHYASAVTFFLMLGYVGLYRAHDTLGLLPNGPQKTIFKNLYRITGCLMWAVPCIAILPPRIGIAVSLYEVEYLGVFSFLIYWVVKSYEMKASLTETVHGIQRAEKYAVGPGKQETPGNSPEDAA